TRTTVKFWLEKGRRWRKARRLVKSAIPTAIVSRCISRSAVSASQSIRCSIFPSGRHERRDNDPRKSVSLNLGRPYLTQAGGQGSGSQSQRSNFVAQGVQIVPIVAFLPIAQCNV